jgi:hypothetical protein
MDRSGGKSDCDESQAFNAQLHSQLPAIIPPSRPPAAASLKRLLLPHWRVIVVAGLASGAGVVTAMMWPPFQNRTASLVQPVRAVAPRAVDGAPSPLATTIKMTAVPAAVVSDICHGGFPSPRIVVSGPPTVMPADAAAALGLTVEGARDGAQLVICGFAAKSVLTAGRSLDETTWVLPVSEIAAATLLPPRGFVGPMKLTIVLVNPDRSLADRQTLQLQWLPQTPGLPVAPRMAEVNEQLEEGKRLKAAGNLAAARAIFQRLAASGDSRAAFLLAETYDPISLAKLQLPPPDADVEKARLWYRRASEKGSAEANSRLERLSNW